MSAHDRSGYLDDGDPVTRATQLFRHVQAQPYHHRIRPGHSALEDVDDDDDVVDDSEARQAAANLAPGGNGQGYGSERSISSWDSEEEARKAQQEWEESIAQLNLALQVMVLPFFGKWLGRKWSYWGALHAKSTLSEILNADSRLFFLAPCARQHSPGTNSTALRQPYLACTGSGHPRQSYQAQPLLLCSLDRQTSSLPSCTLHYAHLICPMTSMYGYNKQKSIIIL